MNAKMVKGYITNKIGESAVDVSIEELAHLTGNKGCCFHPAWMIDGMTAENFTNTSLFVLDFDVDKETGKADLELWRYAVNTLFILPFAMKHSAVYRDSGRYFK